MIDTKPRTFYGVHWWLADNEDFNETDGIETLGKALAEAKSLDGAGKGYHSFTIYAYHAELVDDSFDDDGVLYTRQKWQKIDDDYEALWDINGNKV